MINAVLMVLALLAGVCGGTLFFEGLWRTVSKAVVSRRPLVLVVISFLLRAGLLVTLAFYVVRGNPLRLAMFALGFLSGRSIIFRIHGAFHGGQASADQS